MKTRSLRYITIALVLGTMLTASLISAAQNNNPSTFDTRLGGSNSTQRHGLIRRDPPSSDETTFVGYISDSTCGLKHMSGMGDDKSCTLACVKAGGQFVLADRDHKQVYQLDQAGQDKAKEFAGQKVKVTGTLKGTTISVTSIEAAS